MGCLRFGSRVTMAIHAGSADAAATVAAASPTKNIFLISSNGRRLS